MIQYYNKFRKWENKEHPCYEKYGEWEVNYPEWDIIYDEFDNWINNFVDDPEEINAVLYLIARDNECEVLSEKLLKNKQVALKLAESSISTLHSDAKWQLAKVLSNIEGEYIDEIIYRLSIDRCYYVQRICVMESAKRQSKYCRQMIEWSWLTHDEYQMISALWSLYWINASDIDQFIKKSLLSQYKYLVDAANEIKSKIAQQGDAQ